MLWNYTFFSNDEVVRNAFKALSNFDIEDLDLELLPECYRATIELPKQSRKNPAMDPSKLEDASSLSYIPGKQNIEFQFFFFFYNVVGTVKLLFNFYR